MRSIALLLALVGVSAAATIYAMDGREIQEAMMEMLARERRNHVPSATGVAMGFGTLMGQHEEEGPGFEPLGDEPAEEGAAEREVRGAEAEEQGSVGREGKNAAEGNGQVPHPSGFGPMVGMMFPEMMFGGAAHDPAPTSLFAGNGHAASNGNGHAHPVNEKGNGYSRPLNGNGQSRPVNANGNAHSLPGNANGHSRPVHGNGNKGGQGGAAAASASSFSRGSNSFSSSQAQAFSFGSGNH